MTDRRSCKEQELHQLTHPKAWPHRPYLPVIRRGGNPIRNRKDCGILREDDSCRVWSDIHLGDGKLEDGRREEYRSPEHLLSEWEID